MFSMRMLRTPMHSSPKNMPQFTQQSRTEFFLFPILHKIEKPNQSRKDKSIPSRLHIYCCSKGEMESEANKKLYKRFNFFDLSSKKK